MIDINLIPALTRPSRTGQSNVLLAKANQTYLGGQTDSWDQAGGTDQIRLAEGC